MRNESLRTPTKHLGSCSSLTPVASATEWLSARRTMTALSISTSVLRPVFQPRNTWTLPSP